MARKKKFSFSTKTVPVDKGGPVRFQSQCRSGGGGGNGRCGGGGKCSK